MLIVFAAAGLFLAQAVAPPPPAPVAAVESPAAKPPKPKKVCERVVTTESIIPKTVCRTPEQQQAYRAAEAKRTDSAQSLLRNCQGDGC